MTPSFDLPTPQVVEASSKNIEVAVVEREGGLRFLSDAEVDEVVKTLEEEKEREKGPPGGSRAQQG